MWDGILPLPHEPCYPKLFRFSLCQSGCGGGGDDDDEDDNEDDSLKHSPVILKSMLQRRGDGKGQVSCICQHLCLLSAPP